jgi:hypothetical protein
MTENYYKIPPNLPLLKGGTVPLFGKEGLGEIFENNNIWAFNCRAE